MQGTPKRRGRKKGATVNKAQEIRKVAREMIDKGERPRPIKVVDILAAKGIKVAGPQVSMALRGTGMELRPRPGGTSSRVYLPDPFKAIRQTSIKDLGRAKEFISDMGGIEKAIVAIVAASHVGTDEKQKPPEQTEGYYAGA